MILDRLGLPSRNWHNIPFYFQNRPKRSKSLYLHLFFSHLDIWIVIYQPSMTLFKFNDFSNQCPQLAWGPEDQVSPSRRNEIHQIDPNWTKPKSVKHLLTGSYRDDFFSFMVSGVAWVSHFSKAVGICWNLPLVVVASLGRAEWRVCGVLFFTACLQPKVRALQLSSSTVFNYYAHVWSLLFAMQFTAIMWNVWFFTRNMRTPAMHFVEWLMRSVRLVWDHGWLRCRQNEKQMGGNPFPAICFS